MFGEPGSLYVYRCMGLHLCANVVCEPAGQGAAVLLRAVEPARGMQRMQLHRGGRTGAELTNGPGKLTQAFGIGLEQDGRTLLRGALRVEPPDREPEPIRASPRVGISRAADLPYRFFLAGSPSVSRVRQNRLATEWRARL